MTSLRVFTDDRCLLHTVPPSFPECPARWQGIFDHLRGGELAVEPAAAPPLERRRVERLHTREYLDRFEAAVERGARQLDNDDNPVSAGTWDAAWAAAAVTVDAAEWAAGGEGRHAFALVRPPGHHAEADRAMGFCYLNNVALAADHLIQERGIERVAIFDFDVHHGNGTQHLFEERPDVLFVSTHQFPFYPGTGAAAEAGRGEGRGATINLPLAAGTDGDAYVDVFERHVLPALDTFRPQLLLLSAGFDAWRHDPLGGLRLDEPTFERLGERLAELAGRHCDGRLLSVLEGGYDLEALPRLVRLYLGGLSRGAGGATAEK